MKIGEFADICKTNISVLRHYDKIGLLTPELVDPFTGYRYYSAGQIRHFQDIGKLKKAGFSLGEIKMLLQDAKDTTHLAEAFEAKRRELEQALFNLERAKTVLLANSVSHGKSPEKKFFTEGDHSMNPIIKETANGTEIRTQPFDPKDIHTIQAELNTWLHLHDYQRISGFHTFGEPNKAELSLRVYAAKLQEKEVVSLGEPCDLPFVDDDVVGKWEVVGEYDVKEDFFSETFPKSAAIGSKEKVLYFLPGGAPYWCYRWTKGYFICNYGDCHFTNRYTVENWNSSQYMFIEYKSFAYRHGGKPTTLVLRRLDANAYTTEELARKDNIDMPFADDPDVLDTWTAVSWIRSKDAFDGAARTPTSDLYFKRITFEKGGMCESVYGTEIIRGGNMQTWTKGFVLRKWNSTACAYEIRRAGGVDYLIMEWKSGDYRFGGFDTDYYVFVREN